MLMYFGAFPPLSSLLQAVSVAASIANAIVLNVFILFYIIYYFFSLNSDNPDYLVD